MLSPILRVPNITFYSLQQSVPPRDRSCLQLMEHVIHSHLAFNNFLDTASAISEMDLLVTVDTAVAHLAGALAKPVWMLVQHSPDWRWFLDRGAETPWYPSMQLFRQAQRGHWEQPIQRLADALRRLAGSTDLPIEMLRDIQTTSPGRSLAPA
jgi:ADP-heptose:LPS heptosyltransferase